MIVAIVILAWLLLNTLATLIIICMDEGTPAKASDWISVGLSCVLNPLTILFIIQPITACINKYKFKRKRRKK